VNGFAGADEICSFFPNSGKHGGLSSRIGRQGVREGVRTLTEGLGVRYRAYLVRTLLT
jgi:hypothetical protein